MSFFKGTRRLRSCHLDQLSLVSSATPRILAPRYSDRADSNPLRNTFFYRAHLEWNNLPLEIRKIACPKSFKDEVTSHIWARLLPNSDNDDSFENDSFAFDTG